jgi:hypothetical protein
MDWAIPLLDTPSSPASARRGCSAPRAAAILRRTSRSPPCKASTSMICGHYYTGVHNPWTDPGGRNEYVARRYHASSPHHEGPFVAVNCAQLEESSPPPTATCSRRSTAAPSATTSTPASPRRRSTSRP